MISETRAMNNVIHIHISDELRRNIVMKSVTDRIRDYWNEPYYWKIDPDAWGNDYVADELRYADELSGPEDMTRMENLKLELSSWSCGINPKFGGWNLSQDKRGYWRATRRIRGGKLVSKYIGKDLEKASEILL